MKPSRLPPDHTHGVLASLTLLQTPFPRAGEAPLPSDLISQFPSHRTETQSLWHRKRLLRSDYFLAVSSATSMCFTSQTHQPICRSTSFHPLAQMCPPIHLDCPVPLLKYHVLKSVSVQVTPPSGNNQAPLLTGAEGHPSVCPGDLPDLYITSLITLQATVVYFLLHWGEGYFNSLTTEQKTGSQASTPNAVC